MNVSALHSIGLSEDQVLTYSCLLEHGALTPPQLADITKESRTNAYMSLKKLESLGMAVREESAKKLVYRPVSPAHLDHLLVEQEHVIHAARNELENQLPDMLAMYYASQNKPNITYYEAPDAIKEVYEDQLQTGEDVYFVRTPAAKTVPDEILCDYMEKRAKAGITSFGISPKTRVAGVWAKKNDKKLQRVMTWVDPKQYTAPVEIAIYGNKVAFISFDDEVSASVVESPQIAMAMRELFELAKGGAATKAP